MLKTISLGKICPNPDQPRQFFDEKKLHELASSIKENGLIQPILVRPMPDKTFQIIAGERRWRAHKLLNKKTIACHVRRMTAKNVSLQAIIENLQRADIKPMEEAKAFQAMLDQGFDPEELARSLGLSQSWRVTYRTRLLNLEPEHQKLVDQGAISLNAAQEIAKLAPNDQTKVIQMINRGQIKTDQQVTAAVTTILSKLSQNDFFGDSNKASEKDARTIRSMEAKISQVEKMVSSGWRNGECITASKVSLDRVGHMADKIGAIRKALSHMERNLRSTQTQAELVMSP